MCAVVQVVTLSNWGRAGSVAVVVGGLVVRLLKGYAGRLAGRAVG